MSAFHGTNHVGEYVPHAADCACQGCAMGKPVAREQEGVGGRVHLAYETWSSKQTAHLGELGRERLHRFGGKRCDQCFRLFAIPDLRLGHSGQVFCRRCSHD